jgi:hypothetical protein
MSGEVKGGEAPVQLGLTGRAIFTHSTAGKWLFFGQNQVNKCIFTLLNEDRNSCVISLTLCFFCKRKNGESPKTK